MSGQVSNLKPRVTVECPECEQPLRLSYVSRTEGQLRWVLAPEGERHLREFHVKVEPQFIKSYLSLVA